MRTRTHKACRCSTSHLYTAVSVSWLYHRFRFLSCTVVVCCVENASACRSDTLALPMSMASGISMKRFWVSAAGSPMVSSSA